MLSIAGTRRSLLYGTGSSSDEPFRSEGVGDAACSGPRDDRSLSLLVGRVLLLRVAPVPDVDVWPSGLRADVDDMADADRLWAAGTGNVFRYGDGVVRVSGLKLWPTSRSFVLALLFHRGRAGAEAVDVLLVVETRRLRAAGDGVVTLAPPDVAEGVVGLRAARGIDDFLRFVLFSCGFDDNRRTPNVDRAVLATELPRRLDPPGFGVVAPRPGPFRITDDAGELPGVAMALVFAGLSVVMMVQVESRRCWLWLIVVSSSCESITLMLALSASCRCSMS